MITSSATSILFWFWRRHSNWKTFYGNHQYRVSYSIVSFWFAGWFVLVLFSYHSSWVSLASYSYYRNNFHRPTIHSLHYTKTSQDLY